MAGRPNILVVAGDSRERARVAATISETGFTVFAAAELGGALDALRRRNFAVGVLAPPTDASAEWLRQLRHQQPALPAVLVLAPAALRLIDAEEATIVKRPFDPRQLLGCVFELVLRDCGSNNEPHSRVAELGIAAAQLACLHHRRTAATASGRGRLAQDLAHEIGRVSSVFRDLAAPIRLA
jgi:DNA-binding response OmpR family regulator